MGVILEGGVGGWGFLKGGNNKNQDRVCGGTSVVVGVLSKCEKVEKWEIIGCGASFMRLSGLRSDLK